MTEKENRIAKRNEWLSGLPKHLVKQQAKLTNEFHEKIIKHGISYHQAGLWLGITGEGARSKFKNETDFKYIEILILKEKLK